MFLSNASSPQKRYHVDPASPMTFIVNERFASPFFSPLINQNLEHLTTLFLKRIVRPFNCCCKVTIPAITFQETTQMLERSQQRYSSKFLHDKDPKEKSVILSRKEKKLICAAEYLMQTNLTHGAIASYLELKKDDVKNLAKRIETKNIVLPSKIKMQKKLKSHHINFLKLLLSDSRNATLTLKEMRQLLLDRYHDVQDISITAIRNALLRNSFTFKKVSNCPAARNVWQTKYNHNILCKQLVYSLWNKYQVIFIEASIYCNLKRQYGWGQKGLKLSVTNFPRSQNFTIIAAISDSAVLGCQVLKGGMKKNDFISFICHLARVYKFKKSQKKIILFMDNAPVHRAGKVKSLLSSKITLMYNASYSPQLNPIEEFFSKFKSLIKKMPTSTDCELLQAVQRSMKMFTSEDIEGYIRHTLSFVLDALNYRDFL